MVEDHIAYLIEVLGQDAKIIQPPGDVILLSTETKPVREIHWLRMCVPFNDIFFSSERSLTIERVRGGPFTFVMSRLGPNVPLSMSKWTLPCAPRPQS